MTVTFNSESVIDEFLASFLASARESAYELHLFVVDNASADTTVSRIERYPQTAIDVIRMPRNVGVARGNNQGIRAALSAGFDYVILINNDVTFPPDLPGRLAGASGTACVTVPLIEATEPPGTLWFATGSLAPPRAFAIRHHEAGRPLDELTSAVDGSALQYAPTCCMAIAAETLRDIGPMDPDFFVYGDDVDFCLRLRRSGVTLRLCADLHLVHKASSLTGGVSGLFGSFHNTRSRVLLVRKHLHLPMRLGAYAYLLAYIAARLVTGREPAALTRRRIDGFISGIRAPLTRVSSSWTPLHQEEIQRCAS